MHFLDKQLGHSKNVLDCRKCVIVMDDKSVCFFFLKKFVVVGVSFGEFPNFHFHFCRSIWYRILQNFTRGHLKMLLTQFAQLQLIIFGR